MNVCFCFCTCTLGICILELHLFTRQNEFGKREGKERREILPLFSAAVKLISLFIALLIRYLNKMFKTLSRTLCERRV